MVGILTALNMQIKYKFTTGVRIAAKKLSRIPVSCFRGRYSSGASHQTEGRHMNL